MTVAAQTSMLHIRVDDEPKTEAAEKLARVGLTVSDAVRILLTRVAKEGGLPAGLTADPEAHDAWLRSKVREVLADTDPAVPRAQVMDPAQALIDKCAVPEVERAEMAQADLPAIVDDIQMITQTRRSA